MFLNLIGLTPPLPRGATGNVVLFQTSKTTFQRVLQNQIPIVYDDENDDNFDAYDDDNDPKPDNYHDAVVKIYPF